MSTVESAVRAAIVRIGALDGGYDRGDEGGGAAFWGSGFFIAPGWVLTSAHVVGPGRGAVWSGERVIGITTATGERLAGELALGLPAPADPDRPPVPWGDPDLALVRVPDAVTPEPDCLWLSDRSTLACPDAGVYGYIAGPAPGQERYVAATTTVGGGFGGPLTLSGGAPRLGCSGGPVLDHERRSVIGVSKARVRGDNETGLAAPVTGLRQLWREPPGARATLHEVISTHDRHHLDRYRSFGPSWPRLQAEVEQLPSERGLTAYLRAELFGRLAQLPPPRSAGDVLDLVDRARQKVWRDELRERMDLGTGPLTWRDGVGLLYAPQDSHPAAPDSGHDVERGAAVLYAVEIYRQASTAGIPAQRDTGSGAPAEPARPEALAALRQWINETAMRLRDGELGKRALALLEGTVAPPASSPDGQVALGPSPVPLPGPPRPTSSYADVLVEIGPDLYGTHTWEVKLLHCDGKVSPVDEDTTGVPRGDLERSVRTALARALDSGDVDEHLASVDFIVPRTLFDEPLDLWRTHEAAPEEPFSPHTLPLGHRRLVVLRDGHRWGRPITPEWNSRWSGMADGPLDAVPLCRDVPGTGHGGAAPESPEVAYGRFQGAPRHTVPVHCARTGAQRARGALDAALAAGHPVALWRRCDEQHADCAEFYDRVAALLRSLGENRREQPHGLRGLVRALRNQNAGAGAPDPEVAWARELVLLYDPPHGPRPTQEQLRGPQLQSHRGQDG